MPADPAADFGGVLAATVIKAAIAVAARWRVDLGLGVTQQHQTAHGGISIRFGPINVQVLSQDKVTR